MRVFSVIGCWYAANEDLECSTREHSEVVRKLLLVLDINGFL
jgi:hypothetical protein